MITQVEFRLNRAARVNLQYKDLTEHFAAQGIPAPTLRQVRDAVVEARQIHIVAFHPATSPGRPDSPSPAASQSVQSSFAWAICW